MKNPMHNKLSRRGLLRFGAAGAGVVALGPTANAMMSLTSASPSGGPRLIVVNLKGGNDGLNTFVPQTLSSYAERRGSLALNAGETLPMNSGAFATDRFRLHGALGGVRDLYSNGDVAWVQKIGYPDANGSHFKSQTIYSRAVRDVAEVGGPLAAGWISRYADLLAPTPTGAIAVGSGLPEEFKGGDTRLLGVAERLANFRLEIDYKYQNTSDKYRKNTVRAMLQQFTGTPSEMLVRDTLLQSHELEASVQDADANYASSVEYGSGRLCDSLQSVAKFVQAGFDTRVYYVSRGGFDTHVGQKPEHAKLLAEVDAALTGFAADLTEMGVWDDTVVMVVSEFGRRNFINGSAGTDHGSGNGMMLLGGAVRGGIYGEELVDDDLMSENLEYRTDFRAIYREVLGTHLGAPEAELAAILPEPFVYDGPLGLV